MTCHFPLALAVVALFLTANPAAAQSKPRPRPAPAPRGFQIGGYGMFGQVNLAATETFDAVIGRTSGPIYGGGATLGIPLGGLYVDVGAWRFRQDGERVFVNNREAIALGIPLTVTLTPIEITAGWKFRWRNRRLIPYAGGGFTSYGYRETSAFAAAGEDADERFNGYHIVGGVEYKAMRWLGVAGEATWTTIPDSLGTGGVSQAFGESDLGGTTVRAKITIGR